MTGIYQEQVHPADLIAQTLHDSRHRGDLKASPRPCTECGVYAWAVYHALGKFGFLHPYGASDAGEWVPATQLYGLIDAEHDDEHDDMALLDAARSYVDAARAVESGLRPMVWPHTWPSRWHLSWWKPSDDPIRNLVKAGALIAAEIDRLQRAHNDQAQPDDEGTSNGSCQSDGES